MPSWLVWPKRNTTTSIRQRLGALPKGSTLTFAIITIAATVSVLIARRNLDRKLCLSLGFGGGSIGVHSGWNFFQGPVFGFPVSGQAEPTTLLSHKRVGTDWLSGGDFGPEASLLILPVLGLAFIAMYLWARSPLRIARDREPALQQAGSAFP